MMRRSMPCKVIYVPKGKAFEYCPLAVNLFRGCSHACSYCYVPGISYQTKEIFSIPIPRRDIIEKIRKEAPAHRGHKVFLCFTCDPYQKAHDHLKLPAKAISALHDGGAFVSILTKSGMLSAQDFPLLGRGDEYGATLTFIKKEDSDRWEPGAASPIERIEALEKAHAAGIPTWASIEPVIDPAQSLELIRITHPSSMYSRSGNGTTIHGQIKSTGNPSQRQPWNSSENIIKSISSKKTWRHISHRIIQADIAPKPARIKFALHPPQIAP